MFWRDYQSGQNNAGRHESAGRDGARRVPVVYTGNLRYTDESCKKNKELFLGAVGQNGKFLEYAVEFLKRDTEVILAAVRQYG